jgi:hypothetical protein
MKWMTIDKLGEYVKGREMFVVKAFDVQYPNIDSLIYTSDPWCTWRERVEQLCEDEYYFPRWPHPFMPTHFCLLPEERE